jgi:type I restriction-modification system DNA methylase subunit
MCPHEGSLSLNGAMVVHRNHPEKMSIPKSVLDLIERFRTNRESYLSPHYNETQLRREFVDPFFEALGWDVANKSGFAEAYKDVVHEDSIRIAGAAKSPDYSFRIGGVRKFFVETKKPATNLKDDRSPAFQLRRYAWSAKLPVSILTDFDEFAVYDTRVRPAEGDKASQSRVLYITADEYEARWDELAELFSPEGIRKGALDRFGAPGARRRGSAEVDEEFLREMEKWRKALAGNLALRNESLSVAELNYAVQMTIDRIVFLRIAEDRGLEPFGQLRELLAGDGVYRRLSDAFEKADQRYNSGLFHFADEKDRRSHADKLTLSLDIDDRTVREIIGDLYYPKSPYEFAVFPADILGQVYEQFLGKVVRLTAGHRAVIEDKPDVKKAGGVYYTPSYVVNYIVARTIGPLLVGKRPSPAASSGRQSLDLRILDPACGSGSFLLGAYQYLLDWHRDWYVEDSQKKWATGRAPALRQVENGEWRLTLGERKRILLDCIYGVDIDAQAVEVTKLSLLLKVLEGESQLMLFHERALPDLDTNIKRGNSLLEPDFGQLNLGGDLDVDDEVRLAPFSYSAEFKRVFERKNPGFDAVIGNPPYVLLQWLDDPEVESYLEAKYESARYKINTYQVFTERAVQLLRPGGMFGFITPSSYLRNKYAQGLREFVLRTSSLEAIRVFRYPVFKRVSEDTCITLLRKVVPAAKHEVAIVFSDGPEDVEAEHSIPQELWAKNPQREFGVSGDQASAELASRMDHDSVRLGDFGTAYFGIQTFSRDTYVSSVPRTARYRAVIDGGNIEAYFVKPPTESVDFRPSAIKSGGNADVYLEPRIGVRQIGETPVAALLPSGILTLNTVYNIYFTKPTSYDLKFVLAVICSAPLRWYWRQANFDQKRTFPKIKKEALLGIPIPRVDFSVKSQAADHDHVVKLVDDVMATKTKISTSRVGSATEALSRRVASLQLQIDQVLAKLWDLSPDQLNAMRRG